MPVTWDSNWKSAPADSDSAAAGDDEMREDRLAVEERINNEHTTYNDGTSGNYLLDWNHRKGSAKGYFQNAAPTNRPNGSTALSSDDAGRLWFDDDGDDTPHFYNGSAWKGLILNTVRIQIEGGLSTGQAVVPLIQFPYAFEIEKVYLYAETAPTGADLRIDFEKNGASGSSIFGSPDYATISAGANSGNSSDMDGTANVMAAGDYLTMDIDQVGSTIAGADLTIAILGRIKS